MTRGAHHGRPVYVHVSISAAKKLAKHMLDAARANEEIRTVRVDHSHSPVRLKMLRRFSGWSFVVLLARRFGYLELPFLRSLLSFAYDTSIGKVGRVSRHCCGRRRKDGERVEYNSEGVSCVITGRCFPFIRKVQTRPHSPSCSIPHKAGPPRPAHITAGVGTTQRASQPAKL